MGIQWGYSGGTGGVQCGTLGVQWGYSRGTVGVQGGTGEKHKTTQPWYTFFHIYCNIMYTIQQTNMV